MEEERERELVTAAVSPYSHTPPPTHAHGPNGQWQAQTVLLHFTLNRTMYMYLETKHTQKPTNRPTDQFNEVSGAGDNEVSSFSSHFFLALSVFFFYLAVYYVNPFFCGAGWLVGWSGANKLIILFLRHYH
jgi:hypothetical protein